MNPPRIWDIPTRLLHWALATAVTLNLFVLEDGEDPHKWTGYVAVGLVTLRLLWGLVGSPSARLREFPIHPSSILRYLMRGFADGDRYRQKRNPLAALVYLAIWGLIFALGLSGYMMGMDAYWGETWLEEIHANLSTALMILLGIHLLGIFIDSVRYRRHTWLSMVRGRRE